MTDERRVNGEPPVTAERAGTGDKPSIQAYTDGPLLVRGDVDIVAPDGSIVPRSRATVALCRCGVSTIKPFCDGTHKLVNFKTEPPEPS